MLRLQNRTHTERALAKPHVTAAIDEPAIGERHAAAQPLHLIAILSGLALIVGAASDKTVSLSSQLLPQLPASGIPAIRVLVAGVGACILAWGLWGLLGPALVRVTRLRPWRRSSPAPVPADESPTAAVPLDRPITVRLRCENPVVVDLNSTVPNASIWFEVNSHNGINAVLERIAFDLWAGQPVLSGTMDHRHTIHGHTTIENVHFHGQLTPGAVEQIRKEIARRGPRGRYAVYGTAYFSSASGPFEVHLLHQEREIPPAD